jgi:hypothetical protein
MMARRFSRTTTGRVSSLGAAVGFVPGALGHVVGKE